jgi:hypothetical protein
MSKVVRIEQVSTSSNEVLMKILLHDGRTKEVAFSGPGAMLQAQVAYSKIMADEWDFNEEKPGSWITGPLQRTLNFSRGEGPKSCPACGGPVDDRGRSEHLSKNRTK